VRIDQNTIREILARTEIGGFIGNYVALRKRGNDLVGLCPFHGEKTPSFHVHPDRGFFKCFGCGAGGDVFKFVQLLEGVAFPEAARILAKRAGVELEAESPAAARVRSEKELIYAANELAAAFFHKTLKLSPEAEIARAYCEKRGLSQATIDGFRLGYAPSRWDGLVDELAAAQIDPAVAEKAGLVKAGQRGYYDFYRGRLMIPTYATTGEVVAFGGRALDDSEPKYLNTSTTPVYTKGRGLYALERARRAAVEKEALIVVEGYLDCIALHQAGFTNAVASLGTAFTADQAAELHKYAERIFVCFDADAAGTAATTKSIDVLTASGCTAYIVQLPIGEDPDTFIRTYGAAEFQTRLDGALPWIQFKLDREVDEILAKRLPPTQAARNAETLVRALPREEWDRWRVYLANRLGLAADDLRKSRFVGNPASFAPREGAATFVRHLAPAAELPGIERDVLTTLLEEPALVAEYAGRIPEDIFKDERYAVVYRTLVAAGEQLVTAADALAAFGDDRDAVETLVALQKAERSSKVRFPDSAARRAHLDAIVARLEESVLQRRKRELSERIDRLLEAGQPLPQDDWSEYQSLVQRLDRSAGKRLGTK
jgi:DNA primase catalytic core